MEKIFTIIEVPKEKKLNIGMFYLIGEKCLYLVELCEG